MYTSLYVYKTELLLVFLMLLLILQFTSLLQLIEDSARKRLCNRTEQIPSKWLNPNEFSLTGCAEGLNFNLMFKLGRYFIYVRIHASHVLGIMATG